MPMITDPKASRFQMVLIRSHLKLMDKGLRHSKLSPTKALKTASELTGKPYKRGQFQLAISDLTNAIEGTAV